MSVATSARPGRAAPGLPLPVARTAASGLAWMLGSEGLTSVLGFVSLLVLARRLGPGSYARLEYAAAVVAWLLVLVRGGFDVIVYREAARRPRLVARWTDHLLGLRVLAAVLGYGLALAVSWQVGAERGGLIPVSALLLLVAVGVTDVGPRATGRLAVVAVAQVVRAVIYLGAVVWLVAVPGDALRAAGCLVGAEFAGAAVLTVHHAMVYRPAVCRWRRRASTVLARRGAVAGLTRFGRVTLYGLDLLALGAWAGPGLGPYAAARRVVYALLALGLVVPTTFAPAIGRAWAFGPDEARRTIGRATDRLWTILLPASLGLALTSSRLMPSLFGTSYHDGGPWLALLAARLPPLLSGSFAQATLVACRRETWCARLVAAQLALALLLLPPAALRWGPWGVGLASLVVEAAGAAGGWVLLGRLGVAARWGLPTAATLGGCLALGLACGAARGAPLVVTCLAGVLAYSVVVGLLPRRAPEGGSL